MFYWLRKEGSFHPWKDPAMSDYMWMSSISVSISVFMDCREIHGMGGVKQKSTQSEYCAHDCVHKNSPTLTEEIILHRPLVMKLEHLKNQWCLNWRRLSTVKQKNKKISSTKKVPLDFLCFFFLFTTTSVYVIWIVCIRTQISASLWRGWKRVQ